MNSMIFIWLSIGIIKGWQVDPGKKENSQQPQHLEKKLQWLPDDYQKEHIRRECEGTKKIMEQIFQQIKEMMKTKENLEDEKRWARNLIKIYRRFIRSLT